MALSKSYGQIKRKYTQHKKNNKIKNYILIGTLLFSVGLIVGNRIYTEWTISSLQTAEVHAQEIERPLTPIEYTLQEVEKAGINKYKVITLLTCENPTFNPDARYVNYGNKQGVDRGMFMLNDIHHAEVSNACAYDLKCNVKEAIRILKQRGFDEWSCGKKLGNLK